MNLCLHIRIDAAVVDKTTFKSSFWSGINAEITTSVLEIIHIRAVLLWIFVVLIFQLLRSFAIMN